MLQHVFLVVAVAAKTVVAVPKGNAERGAGVFLVQIEILEYAISTVREENEQMPVDKIL